MNTDDSQRLVQHIRRLAGDPPGTLADGELLRRYLASREEAAFSALVQRHGPMVFSVCQSVLRQRDDAEDAYQATFLILARKAGSIRRQESLGGWLQRVAYRVALQARAENVRRRRREARTACSVESKSSSDDMSWSELRAIVHAEVAALPERFRAPLVLCYLEGLTQEEAARRLDWTAATVKGRLQRGRDKLRRRLERRGVALTAALAAALAGQALAETSVCALRPFTAKTATASAAALARAFLCSWMPMKLMALSALLLPVGLLAGGLTMLAPSPKESAPPAASAEKPADKQPNLRPAVDAHGDPLPDGAVARLGTVRFNHGPGLRHLFFASDGKTIISEGGGLLREWDAATGAEHGRIAWARGLVRPPFFEEMLRREGLVRPETLALTSDGKRMISLKEEEPFGDHIVRVWDLAQRKEIQKLLLHVPRRQRGINNGLAPDGRLAAIGLVSELRIFDLTTGRELCKLAPGGELLGHVAFAGNERIVTTTYAPGGSIELWDARSGKRIRQFAHGARVEALAASLDGRWLATRENQANDDEMQPDKVVRVWDLSTGTKKHTLAARPKRRFESIYFSPDGKRLLTSSFGRDGSELTVWDAETGARVREIKDAYGSILAVSPDGSRLATGFQSGTFASWDLKSGRRLSGEGDRYAPADVLAFSPAGDRLVLLAYFSLSSWETATGRRKDSFELPHPSIDFSLDDFFPPIPNLSSDGRFALTLVRDKKEVRALVWDVGQRRRLHPLKTSYRTSAFSPDSSVLATWERGKDPVIRIREVRTGREVRSFPAAAIAKKEPGEDKPPVENIDQPPILSVENVTRPILSFTGDGKTLLAVGEKIAGFDISSGKELFSWRMKSVPDNPLPGELPPPIQEGKDANNRRAWRGFTTSPDGTLIAVTLDGRSGTMQDRIALFDARAGKLLRRWSDSGIPSLGMEQLVFSRDGMLLASSDGNVVHVWETATGKKIRSFRGHRGEINFLAFSHDDRRLASASSDSTVLIWDATGSPGRLTTDAALEESWKALSGDDAKRAHDAVWTLARTPDKAIPFLKDRLHPVKAARREQLERWIKDLDSDQFAVREKATAELQKLDELAAPALRRTLEGKPSLELRRRIEPILADLEAKRPSGEALRSLRAVRALEHAGTAEARRLLRELAKGAEGATLTRAAQAALTRRNRRAP